jgi:integrative and conjugative element protein (TIGR02256 family)
MSALTFADSLGNKIKIGPRALSGMLAFTQRDSTSREAGGVLLGRFLLGDNNVVVDHITIPTPVDKRTRFRFFRSGLAHQKRISESWVLSRGTCNYLGEWHTHPEGDPCPSTHDLVNWKNKLANDQYDSKFLFFIIIGITKINVWKGYRANEHIEQLMQITVTLW